MLFSETETAKQNQKFPFHFFFRFAVEGWGEETRGKCKEIFWSLHTRVRERVRGALVRITTQSERTRQFQATTRSARAKWVRAKVNTSPHFLHEMLIRGIGDATLWRYYEMYTQRPRVAIVVREVTH